MDFESFYLLGNAGLKGALHVRPRNEIIDPFALLRREIVSSEPIIFEHSSGGEPKDVITTEYPMLYLLSDRVIELFKINQFTGWVTYPVMIYNKNGELINGYQGLAISGICGPLINSKCTKERRDPPTPKGKSYEVWVGLYFDLNHWDGSDFCIPQSTGFKIVTEQVKNAIEKAKFKNFEFKRINEVERRRI